MTIQEQYLEEYNERWQKRIISTNFVAAIIVFIFEVAYYFILTAIGLRDQTSLEYILRYIILPSGIIFSFCMIGRFIVYGNRQSTDTKSLVSVLTTVCLCATAATVHNIFATALCSFFVPLAISVVFGKSRITNIVGVSCVIGEIVAMYFSSLDIRGNDPYFLLDCLML